MGTSIQHEAALGEVIYLRLAGDFHGEERIGATTEGFAQWRGRLRQNN